MTLELEKHLMDMGIIPATLLEELESAVATEDYSQLPSYDEETQEYLF